MVRVESVFQSKFVDTFWRFLTYCTDKDMCLASKWLFSLKLSTDIKRSLLFVWISGNLGKYLTIKYVSILKHDEAQLHDDDTKVTTLFIVFEIRCIQWYSNEFCPQSCNRDSYIHNSLRTNSLSELYCNVKKSHS